MGLRVQAVQLRRANQAADRRGAPASGVGLDEQVVLPIMRGLARQESREALGHAESPAVDGSRGWAGSSVAGGAGLHNHRDCKKRMRGSGGQYRADVTPGASSGERARSIIVRSASRYLCVADGLACPSHSAITLTSTPE